LRVCDARCSQSGQEREQQDKAHVALGHVGSSWALNQGRIEARHYRLRLRIERYYAMRR
jgi:hypothetical protein